MSCGALPPTFRLLDAFVGWDEFSVIGLVGLGDPGQGLRLAPLGGGGGSVSLTELNPLIPPPRLTYDCSTCSWYLATPAPPTSRVLRLDPCDCRWTQVRITEGRAPGSLDAIAVHRHTIAAADTGGGRVWVWSRPRLRGESARIQSVFEVNRPVAIAFASACALLIAIDDGERIVRTSLSGCIHAELPRGAWQSDERVVRLAATSQGTIWAVTRTPAGGYNLWKLECGSSRFEPATIVELAEATVDTGLALVTPEGFCLSCRRSDSESGRRCFSWYGRELDDPPDGTATAVSYVSQGQLLTTAIDSGVPRCRWHRARVEAEVPWGTSIELAVASSDMDQPDDQGVADAAWPGFPTGTPHPDDWQTLVAGSQDVLVDQPPGRFLFVRLRLSGDGTATPRVRRIRLDFPRSTSLEFLPAVYREDARAEDFTERFLSLFDATYEDLDRAVDRFPAVLDSQGVPAEALPWLGRFLDLVIDPAWEVERRRRILAELPTLFPLRGTLQGLMIAIRLVFDVEPVIQEVGLARAWGAVTASAAVGSCEVTPLAARLNTVRLFGRSRARFRVGSSPLSKAPLRSYGNPDLDPLTADAHRFRVLMPAAAVPSGAHRDRLERLVESQKPAHTIASIRVGGIDGFVVGPELNVGIDTRLVAPGPPILGADGTVRLSRMSILRGGSRTARHGPVVGQNTVLSTTC
ncbi:MAG: phage tail protein [bacterium]|nr:phage tail protein [bacterium]